MYLKERRILFTLISTFLMMGSYALYVYNKFLKETPDLINDLQFWGKRMIIFIPIAIGVMILIHIIFFIITKAITKEEVPTESDEMDKMIELKALKMSHWTYGVGFMLAMGSQALGMEVWVLMTTLFASCFLGNIIEALAQIYFYRKGI